MKITFTSSLNSQWKEIEKGEYEQRKKAAKYLKKKLKEDVKRKYGAGDLSDGVAHVNYKTFSKVGFTKPAYHAHLLEFGTDIRFARNYLGHKGLQHTTGRIIADPILKPVIQREADKVFEIMSEPWGGKNV